VVKVNSNMPKQQKTVSRAKVVTVAAGIGAVVTMSGLTVAFGDEAEAAVLWRCRVHQHPDRCTDHGCYTACHPCGHHQDVAQVAARIPADERVLTTVPGDGRIIGSTWPGIDARYAAPGRIGEFQGQFSEITSVSPPIRTTFSSLTSCDSLSRPATPRAVLRRFTPTARPADLT